MSSRHGPSPDEWAMAIAEAAATAADCRRRKVGAVILDDRHRVVSTGCNHAGGKRIGCLDGGCPRGMRDESEIAPGSDYDTPGPGFCINTHAEMDVLIQAEFSRLESATLYCTEEPCRWCMKVISNTHIRRVVYRDSEGKVRQKLV